MLKLGINIVQLTLSHTSYETCLYNNPSNMEAVHAQRPHTTKCTNKHFT